MSPAPPHSDSESLPRSVSLPYRSTRKTVRTLERAGVRAPNVADLTVGGAEAPRATRAAQYLRMSTESQEYSIGYQKEAIATYAKEHGFWIARTYSDEAKSGLTINERPALRSLLADVVGERTDFEAILVYDVSRWGRFQDSDESAYYEFMCRREGLQVHYCAEPFRNDGTAVHSLIKNVKRMMAGEYSRELSEKIFAAKCQAVRMGHSSGSPAVYGYRRLLIDGRGQQRRVLEVGERKVVRADRVVLVPGPLEEVETVRWIFRQVAEHATPPNDLATALNRRKVQWRPGKPWLSQQIQHLLSNEKYIGNTVYNRTSMRLKGRKVANPPSEWIRTEGTHEAIVEPSVFWQAQDRMNGWTTRISNETALVKLRELLDREGSLSAKLIYATPGMPHPAFYRQRFGGLTRAYALVGFQAGRDYRFLRGFAWRNRQMGRLREAVAAGLGERGLTVDRESTVVMRVGEWLRLAVLYAHYRPIKGAVRWFGQYHEHPRPDWMLFARLNEAKTEVLDHCLVTGGMGNYWLGARHWTKGIEERYEARLSPLLDRIASLARGPKIEAVKARTRTR